ncbi:hypothetical protein CRM22_007822 [Opisthorchis felineus]|uniref:Uncharacterized protein n=1 Tax=Opisthorchis felineus TaxID=147828 RepID=A0A4S2LG79_OPIFE|nr:hypothetical protein CRM22_007822 [Opisthorchis felineus]
MSQEKHISQLFKDRDEISAYLKCLNLTDECLSSQELRFVPSHYGIDRLPPLVTRPERRKKTLIPSKLLMDSRPTEPSKLDPVPRAIESFKKVTSRTYVVYLTAAEMLEDSRRRESEGFSDLRTRTHTGRPHATEARKRIFRCPLELVDFQPLLAPFVPEFVRLLVNYIEAYCMAVSWDAVFEPLTQYLQEAQNGLVQLLQVINDPDVVHKLVMKMDHPVRIVVLRSFLNELGEKPIHFQRKHVRQLTKNPLFDLFLRPHEACREVVKHVALASSRGHVDMGAFLMIHLLHAWEAAPNALIGKEKLSSIYGRLMITFAEYPELRGPEYSRSRPIESVLFEVLLETCDCCFWNHLTILKMRVAFQLPRLPEHTEPEPGLNHTSENVVSVHTPDTPYTSLSRDDQFLEADNIKSTKSVGRTLDSTSGSTESISTPADTQSLHSTYLSDGTIGKQNLKPQSKEQWHEILSYISQPVPLGLSLAEVDTRYSWSKVCSPLYSKNISDQFCRGTGRILRDIFRCHADHMMHKMTKAVRPFCDWYEARSGPFMPPLRRTTNLSKRMRQNRLASQTPLELQKR